MISCIHLSISDLNFAGAGQFLCLNSLGSTAIASSGSECISKCRTAVPLTSSGLPPQKLRACNLLKACLLFYSQPAQVDEQLMKPLQKQSSLLVAMLMRLLWFLPSFLSIKKAVVMFGSNTYGT